MKNIIKSIAFSLLAIAAIPMMTACSEDRDSNPTLEMASDFHLNTPAIAKGGSTYDLAKGATLNLTCNQPDFGYTAPIIYEVQVAIDPNFKQTTEAGGDVAFSTLKSTYTSANMNVDGTELNNAVVSSTRMPMAVLTPQVLTCRSTFVCVPMSTSRTIPTSIRMLLRFLIRR